MRLMKDCAMLKDARNCTVTFTDCPMDLVDMSPSSAAAVSYLSPAELTV